MSPEDPYFLRLRKKLAAIFNRAAFAGSAALKEPQTGTSGLPIPTFSEAEQLRRQNPRKYLCPVCGSLKDHFAPGGVGRRRPNAKCPDCGSLERHRMLVMYLANCVWPNLTQKKKDLLHIAPEKFLVDLLKPRPDVNYVSGDLTMSISMARIDLTALQFWDAQFDLIICSHVLEHIPDDIKAMTEMHRVLKNGGYLLVMVPMFGDETYEDPSITDPEERRRHFGQADHVRKYGRDITKRLEVAGFQTRLWPKAGDVDPAVIEMIGSKRREIVECRKLD
jgi:SAM-dependent methyltransferase